MRRRGITISNYRVPRFSIAGKLREIGGRGASFLPQPVIIG